MLRRKRVRGEGKEARRTRMKGEGVEVGAAGAPTPACSVGRRRAANKSVSHSEAEPGANKLDRRAPEGAHLKLYEFIKVFLIKVFL